MARYDQCDNTCTTDCGHCKGAVDAVTFIMRLESEGLDNAEEVIDGVANLIASGVAWTLQGSYGRMARAMIDSGWIDEYGNVLGYPEEC